MVSGSSVQITIDGPAASGKSSVAQRVAEMLNAVYVNTGEMYRALTWFLLANHLDPDADPDGVVRLLQECEITLKPVVNGGRRELVLYLNGDPVDLTAIRKPRVTRKVSQTAKIPGVRTWMVERQREAAGLGRIVVEGRDIGTVVFPEARYKFFLTATAMERAKRRLAQSGEVSPSSTVDSVAREIENRDRLDSTRSVAPLKAAADAIVIDTTGMSIDQVVDHIVDHIRAG